MKYNVCLVLLVLSCSCMYGLQPYFGIVGGMNYNYMGGKDPLPDYSGKTGFSVGIMLQEPVVDLRVLGGNLLLHEELLYSTKGWKTEFYSDYYNASISQNVNTRYLGVSFSPKLDYVADNVHIQPYTGIGFNNLVSSGYTEKVESLWSTENNGGKLPKASSSEVYWQSGLDIMVPPLFMVGVRYSHSFTNVYKPGALPYDLKNRTISLNLTMLIDEKYLPH